MVCRTCTPSASPSSSRPSIGGRTGTAPPWNATTNESPPLPPTHFWASDERGFGQVGSIYTAQEFEYDWAGVIFGADFVCRGDRWVARREHSCDPTVARASEAHFGALISNTYKVLMTRGLRGVCLHSVAPETQDYLRATTA
jgi:uncharacterized protein